MIGPVLVVLLGVALIAFSQRPHRARQDWRTCRPCPPRRHRLGPLLRLIFDVVTIPLRLAVMVSRNPNRAPRDSQGRTRTIR